jgi:hypothetical protein
MLIRKITITLIFCLISLNLYATDAAREAQYAKEISAGNARDEGRVASLILCFASGNNE